MEAGVWTGKMLGKYEIGPLIGQGGMAQVYKGHHQALKRDVAIKLIHSYLVSGQGFIERFQREAQLVASLRHPNIVQVFDLDVFEGTYYMVMEFIDGSTLSAKLDQLRNEGKLFPPDQAVDLMLSLCSALDYAHSLGMIHRDVKPGNVMFTSKAQPVLTDFGLAKIVSGGATSTTTGSVVGTPMYMSPEQATGASGDARSDIYALGVMLFELVTGSLPYEGDTPLSIIFKQVNEPLPSARMINPRVPDWIEHIIVRATAKKPEDRYQTCGEFANALREGQSGPATPQKTIQHPKRAEAARPTMIPSKARPAAAAVQTAPGQKTISLDELKPIFVQILGPVGRIMELNRVAGAMKESPTAFPATRLDEFLDRIAAQYRLSDPEKKEQIRQSAHELFGN